MANLTEIEVMAAKANGALGSPMEILEDHTLLRFYQVFLTPHELTVLLTKQRKTAVSQLKYPMGLWNNLFTARHPLKACVECIARDEGAYGMPYWHLAHQYPGVGICLEHSCELQLTSVITTSTQRFHFHTPRTEALLPRGLKNSKRNLDVFRSLAVMVTNLVADREEGATVLKELKHRFLEYLGSQGMSNGAGHLKVLETPDVLELCEKFCKEAARLHQLPEFQSIPKDLKAAHRLLSTYVNGRSYIGSREQIALMFWFRSLPFWTTADEKEWGR
jgi:hypothetical protein